jgi:hypothetical protein
MTIANKWYGAITPATQNPAPVAGGSFNAGDAIIGFTWENPGSDTVTPSGAAAIDFNTNAHQVRVFAFVSTTGAESMPTFAWNGGTTGRAFVACYSGVDSGLATGGNPTDRTGNTTADIVSPAVVRLPSVNGCLCLYYGIHKKTLTSNGTTFSPPGGTGFTIPVQSAPNNNDAAFVLGEWIQGTATSIASGLIFSGSVAEGSAVNMQSGIIILKPGPNVIAPSGGQETFSGQTPSVVGATATVLTPLTARERFREVMRKYYLPPRILVPA